MGGVLERGCTIGSNIGGVLERGRGGGPVWAWGWATELLGCC